MLDGSQGVAIWLLRHFLCGLVLHMELGRLYKIVYSWAVLNLSHILLHSVPENVRFCIIAFWHCF